MCLGGGAEWLQSVPDPPQRDGEHDIVKHYIHPGMCRMCGKLGSWEFIKAQPCPGKLPEQGLAQIAGGDAKVSEEELNGELDCLEEAELALQLLQIEELEYELQYEEMQLQQLQALEKGDDVKPSAARPPATPCASPIQPPSLPTPATCFLSRVHGWFELRS